MNKDESYLPQQPTDDRIIVEEMLRDLSSGQWFEWYLLVNKLVHSRANNIPLNQRDDIVQEAMLRIHKYLPTFQFNCALKTWVFQIVRCCIIDAYRKSIHAGQFVSLIDPHDDAELEGEVLVVHTPVAVEDECMIRDELRRVLIALQEFVSLHSNPTRNRAILKMVFLEDRSLEETALAVGCSAPVVGYVVRSARRYIKENLGNSL